MRVSQWRALIEPFEWARDQQDSTEIIVRELVNRLEKQGLVIVPYWMIADNFANAEEPSTTRINDE
jgi:hypothetical protein